MWKRSIVFALVCAGIVALTGCSKVRVVTGFSKSQFANVNGVKTDMAEACLLLAEEKHTYERLFNANVWTEPINDVTTEQYVKDGIGDTIEQITILNGMSENMDITLTDNEKQQLSDAAKEYWDSIDEDSTTGWFDQNTVNNFYTRLYIAEKVFYSITGEVDTEVSEDEARIIDVQYIFISTSDTDEDGNEIELSQAAINKKNKLANELRSQIKDGADFGKLVEEYSDDNQSTLELGRGQYDGDFEDAAFRLNMGDVSDVVNTKYGYYIIKCTNDNVDSDFDKRSQAIVLERRTQAFAKYYADYTENIYTTYNDRFWSKTSMKSIPEGSGKLYEIYKKYFVSTQLN